MTMGASAWIRESTAEVSHVVQPRLLAPVIVNLSISSWCSSLANFCAVSIARTADRTIGMRSGQSSPSPWMNLLKVSAIRASSLRSPSIG